MKLQRKVILAQSIHPDGLKLLTDALETVVVAPDTDPATFLAMGDESVDAVIVRRNPVTAEMIDRCPNLKIIAQHGAGTDLIDLKRAAERGIVVTNTPFAPTVSVAEHTLMFILMLSHKIRIAGNAQRSGNFAIKNLYAPDDVNGRTVGIIGLGRIGRLVAEYCTALHMNVIAYSPHVPPAEAGGLGVTLLPDLDGLLRQSDFVTIHTPLRADTRHLIDGRALSLMKPTAYLISCGRGEEVDEMALLKALKDGTIAGAALDVFETEPTDADGEVLPAYRELFEMDNVVVSPHSSAMTVDGARKMATHAASQVIKVLSGGEPDWRVV